jgi:hypothetical protein
MGICISLARLPPLTSTGLLPAEDQQNVIHTYKENF